MTRHRIKHHVNRPILHWGVLTDAQILPAAGLFTMAAGWAYAGAGNIILRSIAAALLLLPVGIMAVDNRVGGIVVDQAKAFLRWHRQPGIFEPGTEDVHGYALVIDAEEQLVLEREKLARVDLETVFAQES